jgi:hypothetical protein
MVVNMSWKNFEMVPVVEIVKNPDRDLEGRIRTVYDQRMKGFSWDNLEKALSILAEKGWKPVCAAAFENTIGIKSQLIYVVIEKKE